MNGGRRMRVLQSVRGPSPTTNPYITQLVDALRIHAEVDYFGWWRGITGRYDVVHLHWPEVMLRRDGRAARAAARLRFALFMARVALLRTPLVRTVHNVRTHESGDRVERVLLRWCERRTTAWILLNPDTAPPGPGPTRVILHGHYRDAYPAARSAPVPGRLLHFGLIRPYKGVETLLAAFGALEDPSATLRVVGRTTTAQLRNMVTEACAVDPRVRAELSYVDDAGLAEELARAQLVVLPYREMHNSGALLLALSLDRPVLVPRGPTTEAIAAEVGPGWVFDYDGELSAADLAGALAATGPGAARPAHPDLDAREWPALAGQHLESYREAAATRRPR